MLHEALTDLIQERMKDIIKSMPNNKDDFTLLQVFTWFLCFCSSSFLALPRRMGRLSWSNSILTGTISPARRRLYQSRGFGRYFNCSDFTDWMVCYFGSASEKTVSGKAYSALSFILRCLIGSLGLNQTRKRGRASSTSTVYCQLKRVFLRLIKRFVY